MNNFLILRKHKNTIFIKSSNNVVFLENIENTIKNNVVKAALPEYKGFKDLGTLERKKHVFVIKLVTIPLCAVYGRKCVPLIWKSLFNFFICINKGPTRFIKNHYYL